MDDAPSPLDEPAPATVRPVMRQVVLDATDARVLAEFYRQLLGWGYRDGDHAPAPGEGDPRGADWLVLRPPGGGTALAVQQVAVLAASTWPRDEVPQQAHLDLTVATRADLEVCHQSALALGARVLLDRTDDVQEPLWVYADPAGHPFCIFVAV